MTRPHTHPCRHCETPVDCDGTYERNYDGYPEAICPSYHLASGVLNPDWLCSDCNYKQELDRAEGWA